MNTCETCRYYEVKEDGADCSVEIPFYDPEHYLDGSNEFSCKFWEEKDND